MKTALLIIGFIIAVGVGGEYELSLKFIGAALMLLGLEQ